MLWSKITASIPCSLKSLMYCPCCTLSVTQQMTLRSSFSSSESSFASASSVTELPSLSTTSEAASASSFFSSSFTRSSGRVRYLSSRFLKRIQSFILSQNLVSFKQPYLMNGLMSSQYFSQDSLSVLHMPISLSATFFVMYSSIFLTNPSFCRAERETLSGRSGQSITPFKSIRNSGITSLILSAINTWLLYNLIVPSMESYSVLIFGKYRIPFKLNG